MRTDTPHYLAPTTRTSSPRRVIFLDTETRATGDGQRTVEILRLWRFLYLDRAEPDPKHPGGRMHAGRTADGLAQSINLAAGTREPLTVFAHNLAFDLVTTRLPEQLAALGWELADVALSAECPWVKLRRGRATLTITDSYSWLPLPLQAVGKLLGTPKLPLPGQDATDAVWGARCERDVRILAAAMLRLMDWHDRDGHGRWGITGPSTGWGQAKFRLPARMILLDPVRERDSLDRAAIYGGRRTVTRVGDMPQGRYVEVDFVAAYPTITAHIPTPVRRGVTVESLPLDHPWWGLPGLGMLARCVVTTDRPRYPLRTEGGVFYPVGRFTTVLAGPELQAARARGDLVSVGRCDIHMMGTPLRGWAQWCLDLIGRTGPDADLIVQAALKPWSRTVIGRFAGHSWTKLKLGPAPGPGWRYEAGADGVTGRPGGMLDLAGQRWWVGQEETAPTAYPAVTAWVEAAVRTRLADMVDLIGPGAVVTANTDGIIVREAAAGTRAAGSPLTPPPGLRGAARLAWIIGECARVTFPLVPRAKATHLRLTVLGPQHIRFGQQRRLPGIPTDADDLGDNAFSFQAWPKLPWQLTRGDTAGYVRPTILRKLDGPYPPGWVTVGGHVVPPSVTITTAGANRMAAWHDTELRPSGARLTGKQHPHLDTLL